MVIVVIKCGKSFQVRSLCLWEITSIAYVPNYIVGTLPYDHMLYRVYHVIMVVVGIKCGQPFQVRNLCLWEVTIIAYVHSYIVGTLPHDHIICHSMHSYLIRESASFSLCHGLL